jgi:hypothetical protein
MADTEIESMVVKLKGDATSYEKMVKDAEKSIRRLTGTMQGEDTKIAAQARAAATAVMEERKKAEQQGKQEQDKLRKEREADAKKNSVGSNLNAAWSITEKSFIQSIRAVDAMMSRTVASITNGIEGIVRVSVAAGAKIVTAWAGVFNKLTLGLSGMVGAWLGSVGKFAGSVASMLDKALLGIPSAIATTLGGVSQVVGTVLAGAFGVAGAAVLAFGREVTNVFHETMQLNSEAKQLGVTILDLRAGVLWSGVAMSTFTGILANVQTKINDLKMGSVQTTREFRNFSAIANRSIDQLAGGGFNSIVEGLAAIPDATQRASVAFSILGDQAGKILGAIERGGVGEAKGLAKRLGLEVDPASMQSLKQIAEFTRQVETLKTGLVNQVMLGLAPIAAELTSTFNLSKVDITWIKNQVTNIGLEIMRWGAMIKAAFSDPMIIRNFFEVFKLMIDDLMGSIKVSFLRMLSQVARAAESFVGKSVGDKLELEARRTEIGRIRIQKDADVAMRFAMKGINESQTMEDFNAFAGRVRDRMNAPPPAADKANIPRIAVERLNQSFDRLIESLKQPIDVWKQSLAEFKRFSDISIGKFQGRGGEQSIAAAQMFKQLRESVGMGGTPMFAGAATAGSTEAYSAIAQFQALRDRGDIQQQMKDTLLQANRQRDLLIANGQAVIRALNKMGESIDEMIDAEADLTGG